MKFNVDDKNGCRLVCAKFRLNRCRFAAAVAKCLGGSLFLGHTVFRHGQVSAHISIHIHSDKIKHTHV